MFSRRGLGVGTALLLASCGAKGPPKPPLSKAPEPVRGLTVRQIGPAVEVRWSRPARRLDEAALDSPLKYLVLARARIPDDSLAGVSSGASRGGPILTRSQEAAEMVRAEEEAFLRSSSVVAEIDELPTDGSGEARRELSVTLGPDDFPGTRFTNVRLDFAVVAVDPRGRRSRPRPIVEIDPVEAPPPPESLSAIGSPTGVLLSWRLPVMAGGTGVNVYRREPDGERPGQPISGSPFEGVSGLDSSARVGESYVYEARLVITAPGKGVRESLSSNEARIDYTDRFPPAPPSLVTAIVVPPQEAASAPSIQLDWSPSPDSDRAGYRIYRAGSGEDFSLAAQVAGEDTTWLDRNVEAETVYRYYVTAIDGATPPNESERSEIVETETVGAEPAGPDEGNGS